ncbi:DEAD/DEAH box helicase [Ideonella benzenivorans]|uniref:DEAD/DEAH box helicase n=1 Tax=Ideonella benzenivorans TaxID=2831643 RepID=UPI001CED7FD2|nr:DEAD/DEAH box helicase [Ideonella benzenivorans]
MAGQVAQIEAQEATGAAVRLNKGQRATLRVFGTQLPRNGMVLADEVGMGKTRIAVQLIDSVVRSGGRVAVLIPSGLGYQWQRELRGGGLETEYVLRGIVSYMDGWAEGGPIPWNQRKVVVLSHAFSNWKIQENAHSCRWILLPALVAVLCDRPDHIRKVRKQHYGEEAWLAAKAITRMMQDDASPAGDALRQFAQQTQWEPLLRPATYAMGTEHRSMLMKAVGLGFGLFDLVVVDEAHKSRGEDSRLSRLLDEILHVDDNTRYLAMSATPVELDAGQWVQTLERIRIPAKRLQAARDAIDRYAEALQRVRLAWRTSGQARDAYTAAAADFQRQLGDFVVRRDKREDADVLLYEEHAGGSYRATEGQVLVDPEKLSLPWRQAVCAAEALSLIRGGGSRNEKYLRTTFASGHGTSKFLDEDVQEEERIEAALNAERARSNGQAEAPEPALDAHARQRAAFWRASLRESLHAVGDTTYEHPVLREAVRAIEKRAVVAPPGEREKVLVFGRFTRQMRALELLLNARELLRRLAEDRYWPQRSVRASADGLDQWPAIRAAHRQWTEEHGAQHPIALQDIDDALAAGYRRERNLRKRFRQALVQRLGDAFTAPSIYRTLCAGLQAAAADAPSGDEDGHPVAVVARALLELTANAAADMETRELGQEFAALVDAVMDNDAAEADADAQDDPAESWAEFQRRLEDEFGTRTGEFARFMHGGTKTESRRMLQQAFNRSEAAPMVLIAQSLVGREGLNLHEACRVVVLLHPEWNPGVVEQQIGRVDRVGSRWAKELHGALRERRCGEDLPRIEVLPVIFRGTYDEHHWRVLRERWDDLRAQLHGEVIPPRLVGGQITERENSLLDQLKQAAPSFSPTAPWRNAASPP